MYNKQTEKVLCAVAAAMSLRGRETKPAVAASVSHSSWFSFARPTQVNDAPCTTAGENPPTALLRCLPPPDPTLPHQTLPCCCTYNTPESTGGPLLPRGRLAAWGDRVSQGSAPEKSGQGSLTETVFPGTTLDRPSTHSLDHVLSTLTAMAS